jgi:hypothetical protein
MQKSTYIALLSFLIATTAFSQNISVKSFKNSPNDLVARVDHPVTDKTERLKTCEQKSVYNKVIRKNFIINSDNITWVKSVTKKYSPDSWQLLMNYKNLPLKIQVKTARGGIATTTKSGSAFSYLEGNSKIQLLKSMSTNVHETAHGYSHFNAYHYAKENKLQMYWNNVNAYFYLSPTKFYFVSFPKRNLFPSRKLVQLISKRQRTFRFNTYIAGNTSTQSEGIIGLLDEMHAYYLGSKFSVEMLKAYKIAHGSAADGFFYWVSNTQSSLGAYYEFDYFIKTYLIYMKKNSPGKYASLKSYPPFCKAYRTVQSLYKELIKQYKKTIKSEIKKINASGKAKAGTYDNTLWISFGKINSFTMRTSLFHDDKFILLPELGSKPYLEIEKDFFGF